MQTFHAEYRPTNASETGCVQVIMSKPAENSSFPAQVMYACGRCERTHPFRLVRTHLVGTPRQVKRFREYCEANEYDLDVRIV